MSRIKILSDDIVNQIAAGEIVESPSSALKEIIENSIDAHSSNIDIFVKKGGKSKIVVEDNGEGLEKDDLNVCILRHATSKLSGNNLFDISSYGFRGEALPSIASVSDFSIESGGYGLSVSFSETSDVYESNIQKGTRVCISDIFDKLPARMKFLKSDNAELEKCIRVVENFALTQNKIDFSFGTEKGSLLSFSKSSLDSRVREIYGEEQTDKSIYFEDFADKFSVKGYLFHPAYSKYSLSHAQRLFVNNRIVKDRIVSVASKIGYKNIIDPKRYPLTLLFIEIDPFFIDVNVSPTKSEIRFRDEQGIQKFLIRSISKQVEKFNKMALDFDLSNIPPNPADYSSVKLNLISAPNPTPTYRPKAKSFLDSPKAEVAPNINPEIKKTAVESMVHEEELFFGRAIGQIFGNYIVSVNDKTEEIFIIDQHAVHEKIILNKIEERLADGNVKYLLRPEMINVSGEKAAQIEKYKQLLEQYGFKTDIIQTNNAIVGANVLQSESSTVIINAIPGIMTNTEAVNFLQDFFEGEENFFRIDEYFRERLGNAACHNSIRSGRILSAEEMNGLLKQMENNKEIFQCNHHRPSFLKISKKKLESMFERN